METPPEVERHVTALPDGRVLKGPRPVQRRNAQFWADVSQDTEELVKQVQTPEVTAQEVSDEQTQASVLPTQPDTETPHVVAPRSAVAKRAARAARKDKTERPIASGPKPSQRGFKWPTPPSQAEA
jgi:hypothetical protein